MSNLVWESMHNGSMELPFLTYWHEGIDHSNLLYSTKNFVPWMIGQKEVKEGKFGTFNDRKNFLKIALEGTSKFIGTKDNRSITNSKIIIKQLQKLQKTLNNKEKRLYKDLKCKDFLEFRALWEGQNNNNNNYDIVKYWINKHLDLLTGQTQRLISGKNWTLIEQLLELVSIKLDVNNELQMSQDFLSEGLNAKFKRCIKEFASQVIDPNFSVQLLKDISEENYTTSKRRGNAIFVPSKKKNGKRLNEDEIISGMIRLFEDSDKQIGTKLSEQGQVAIVAALKEIQLQKGNKELYYQTELLGKTPAQESINNLFITLHFNKTDKKPQKIAQSTCRELMRYFRSARPLAFSAEERAAWKLFENQNGEKQIEENFLILIEDFLRNNQSSYQKFLTEESNIMGFFGELSTYGKTYFNIKKDNNMDINLFWTGMLLSGQTGKQLSYDMIIKVNNQNYGIQVKNPYATEQGYYEVYKDTFSLENKADKNGNRFYQNYLGMEDEEQIKCFQHLNLNMNNPVNSEEIKRAIMSYFYLHSDKFIRIFSEEIREDLFEEQLKKELKDNSAINVFFVLKGEIFPSSMILKALIQQYEYFIEPEKTQEISVLKLDYSNTIKPTEVPIDQATKEFQPNYVIPNQQDSDINNLLSQIKLKTSLTLKVPSMKELMNL